MAKTQKDEPVVDEKSKATVVDPAPDKPLTDVHSESELAAAKGTVTQPALTPEERQELVNKTYAIASHRLREAHRDEFNRIRKDAAKELGVEWTPKLTDAEKAEAKLLELLAAHPHLRDKVAPPAAENQVGFEDVPLDEQ